MTMLQINWGARSVLSVARLADNIAVNAETCAAAARAGDLAALSSHLVDLSIDARRTADHAFRVVCENFDTEDIVSSIDAGDGFASVFCYCFLRYSIATLQILVVDFF